MPRPMPGLKFIEKHNMMINMAPEIAGDKTVVNNIKPVKARMSLLLF